jgi:4-hydroxybenzoate polyprenyltransferase
MNKGKLKEYAKFIRVQSFGFSTIAVIGALCITGEKLEILHFFLLFLIGIMLTIYSFVLNDYKDVKKDKISEELNERPLVKGTISLKSAKYIIFFCLIMIFLIQFIFFRNVLTLLVLIISIIFGTLYNLFSKRIVGSDIFIAGELVFFCLFGAFAVSDNLQNFQEISGLTWIVVLIIFFHVFFANAIGGGLKDAKSDLKTGAKKITLYLGVNVNEKMIITKRFKAIAYLLKITMIILVFIPFLLLDLAFWYWQIILLIFFVIFNLRTTIKMLTIKYFDKEQIIVYTGKDVFSSFCIILFMMMSYSGVFWTLLLISLPLIWYKLFDYLIYGNMLRNPKML